MTEGLQESQWRPSVNDSAGSETRAERSSHAGAAANDDGISRWDPLPGEIDGIQRDLGNFEARWQTPPRRETTMPTDPLPEIRVRLDNLEIQLQADGP
jgi:hypothetical protein